MHMEHMAGTQPVKPPLPVRRIFYDNVRARRRLHRGGQGSVEQLQFAAAVQRRHAVATDAGCGCRQTTVMCRMAEPTDDLGGKISDELLVCKICYSRFSANKLPKLLVCSHTFCEPCVSRYHKTTSRTTINDSRSYGNCFNEEVFPCPLCRKTTTLPEGGVQKLPNNLTVMSLMELVDRQPTCCMPLRAPSVCSLGGEPVYLTSASGTRTIGKSCSQDRIALALGVLCSVQTCAVCDRKYPESEFPCGHCICSMCCSFASQDAAGNLQCPKCAGELGSGGRSPDRTRFPDVVMDATTSPDTVTSQPTSIHTAPEPLITQPPEPLQTPASSHESNTTFSSPPLPIHSSSSPASDTVNSEKLGSESSEKDHLQVIADAIQRLGELQITKELFDGKDRDPPYNPSYVENPLYGNPSQIKTSSAPPSVTKIQRERLVGRSKASSLPRVSPKHISSPIPEPSVYTREQRLARVYDSAYNMHNALSLSSLKTCNEYGSLRRSDSFRQPPVPPKRRFSTPRLFRRLSLRRRSKSCPENNQVSNQNNAAQPTAPDGVSEPHYQIPSSIYRVPPPVPPPRRIYDSPSLTPIKCIKKFGMYSEIRMQTNTFRSPTRVAVSDQGDIVVVDVQHMTVQVFTLAGDYLSMFKVVGVQGASFFSPDRLAVATHRGISIYSLWGQKMQDLLTPSRVANTVPYKFGFVACAPRSVYIYRQSLTLGKEITSQGKPSSRRRLFSDGKTRKQSQFEKLQDVCVTMCKQIALLDAGKGVIYVVDEEGSTKLTIEPALQACGQLREPQSITVDRSNNLYVSDTGNQRVLRFANNGAYSRCIINCKTQCSDKKLAPYGLATTSAGHLVVVIAGIQTAEVRIYQVS